MSYQDLLYSVDEKVATITLNRPDRMNALSRSLEAEIYQAMDEADADRSVRAIILTGAGAAFCAGYDQTLRRPPACGIRIPKARRTPSSLNIGRGTTANMWRNGSICGGSASRL